MSTEPKDAQDSVIAKLHQTANPDPSEFGDEELELFLAEQGADLSLFKTKLDACFDQAIKKSQLQKAKKLLAETRESLGSIGKQTSRAVSDIRAEIERRIGSLGNPNSGLVQAYFQKYEDLSDEDLPDLLQELEMLNKLDG